jgi:hypothetical protein
LNGVVERVCAYSVIATNLIDSANAERIAIR